MPVATSLLYLALTFSKISVLPLAICLYAIAIGSSVNLLTPIANGGLFFVFKYMIVIDQKKKYMIVKSIFATSSGLISFEGDEGTQR